MDGDGEITLNDAYIMISWITGYVPPDPPILDINGDGTIDLFNDYLVGMSPYIGDDQFPLCKDLVSNHTHTGYEDCVGDVDRDGDVDINDIRAILKNEGGTPNPNWAVPAYDVDQDGDIDIADALAAIDGDFGATC